MALPSTRIGKRERVLDGAEWVHAHLCGGVVHGVAQGEQDGSVLVGVAVVGVAHERSVGDVQPCAVRADVAGAGGAVGERRRPDQARLVACACQQSLASSYQCLLQPHSEWPSRDTQYIELERYISQPIMQGSVVTCMLYVMFSHR